VNPQILQIQVQQTLLQQITAGGQKKTRQKRVFLG